MPYTNVHVQIILKYSYPKIKLLFFSCEIVELKVVYAVQDSNNAWWLMDKTGRIVDSTNAAAAKDYTGIAGVRIQEGVIGQQAVAYEDVNT